MWMGSTCRSIAWAKWPRTSDSYSKIPTIRFSAPAPKREIAFGPTALGLDAATVFKRVDEMMTLFDLHRYEDVSPATLGYGERRAVALSSVIAMRTPILVLDEPTAGLDHRLASRFLGTVENSTGMASPSS